VTEIEPSPSLLVIGADSDDAIRKVEQGIPLLRILTDRGSEYYGNRKHHEYVLSLDLDGIDHTRSKTNSPQTNSICERFHQTIQNAFYATAFRRKLYDSLEQLQADVDEWIDTDNRKRTHSGKHGFGKTPWQTLVDSKPLAIAKQLDRTMPTVLLSIESCLSDQLVARAHHRSRLCIKCHRR